MKNLLKKLLFTSAVLILYIQSNAQDWTYLGNTLLSIQFLGTTNVQDLRFNTNNSQKMTITTTGNLGDGLTASSSLLHVARTTNSLGNLFRTDGQNSEINQWRIFTGATLGSQTEKFKLYADANAIN